MNIKNLFIIVLLLGIIISSCSSISIPPHAMGTEKFTDTLMVNSIPSKSIFETELSLIEVKDDSRCPENAQCKWAGNAEVTFLIKNDFRTHKVTLNTNDKFQQEINKNGYSYKLLELFPKRKKNFVTELNNYKAKILITKR